MRLTEFEAKSIILNTKLFFGSEARVYLFGSRIDDGEKGGDIDLYIIPEDADDLHQKKTKYLVALKQAIGEQKIDIVFAKDPTRSIEQVALKDGVELNILDLRTEVSRFSYATMRNKAPINEFCVGLPRLGQRVAKSLSRAA